MAWEINLIGVARERERAEAGDSGEQRSGEGQGQQRDRGRQRQRESIADGTAFVGEAVKAHRECPVDIRWSNAPREFGDNSYRQT